MFNPIELVRELCKEKNIRVSTLEKECGCGNGYFNPKKQKSISYEKAVAVAERLGVSVEYIMTGIKENPPAFGEGVSEKRKEALDLVMNLPEDELDRFVRTLRAFADK